MKSMTYYGKKSKASIGDKMRLTKRQLKTIIRESFYGPSDAMIRAREAEPDPSDLMKDKSYSRDKANKGYQTPGSDEDKLEEITDIILDYFDLDYESEDYYEIMETLATDILNVCK